MTTAGSADDAYAALDPPDEAAGEEHGPAREQLRGTSFLHPEHMATVATVPAGVDLYENNAWFADATVKFMILKAWEYRADAKFAARFPLVKSSGRYRGAYLFGHPSKAASVQAASFTRVLGDCGFGPGDTAWLDHEVTDGKSPSWCAAWAQDCCGHIDAGLGLPHGATGVYTYTDFIARGNCAGLGNRPLWFARPSPLGALPAGVSLGPWKRAALVQYTVTSIDWDYFNGTADQLKASWGVHQPAPAPQPEPRPPHPASWTEALMAALPILKIGSTGEDVATCQGLLNARGYGVKIDKAYGPATRSAVTAFQHIRKLTADGQCGPLTWKALVNR